MAHDLFPGRCVSNSANDPHSECGAQFDPFSGRCKGVGKHRHPAPNLRTISAVALDISNTWTKIGVAAAPYLFAMAHLKDRSSKYGADSAEDIVLRFLTNAHGFRGGRAPVLKLELELILKK